MFRILKRKKQIQELERNNEKLRQRLHISEGCSAGLNSQVIQLRGICKDLNDQVLNNCMTHSEFLFISMCRDVYRNNKMISQYRFTTALRNIEYERSQMEAKRINNKEKSNDI